MLMHTHPPPKKTHKNKIRNYNIDVKSCKKPNQAKQNETNKKKA